MSRDTHWSLFPTLQLQKLAVQPLQLRLCILEALDKLREHQQLAGSGIAKLTNLLLSVPLLLSDIPHSERVALSLTLAMPSSRRLTHVSN